MNPICGSVNNFGAGTLKWRMEGLVLVFAPHYHLPLTVWKISECEVFGVNYDPVLSNIYVNVPTLFTTPHCCPVLVAEACLIHIQQMFIIKN